MKDTTHYQQNSFLMKYSIYQLKHFKVIYDLFTNIK